jgi:hypothetical protein
MTERFTPPVIKFTTDVLRTLPLATLKFYVAGTTTPKAVYADKYMVTSLGSTVTADSAGNFPPIFLDGVYRVDLLAAGSEISQTGWPVDNFGGSIDLPFDEWVSEKPYDAMEIVSETISPGVVYRYESTQDNNENFRPSLNPSKWRRIFFGTVAELASGSQVASNGVNTNYCTIINGQKLSLFFSDEEGVGLLNIMSVVSGVYKAACYFVSIVGPVTEISDPSAAYSASSSPAAGQIGIYSDGNHSILIKNNTGVNIDCIINVNGAYISGITDNA